MASNPTVHPAPPTREMCKYFLSNVCRFGDQCTYSHDRRTGEVNNVCRFYLQGRCTYGDRCRYDHVRSKTTKSNIAPPLPLAMDKTATDPLLNLSHNTLSSLAPPFQPAVKTETMSYASVCRLHNDSYQNSAQLFDPQQNLQSFPYQPICPFAAKTGTCETIESGNFCPYIHGELCDLCEMPVLHPYDEQQREQHRAECIQAYQAECDEAFAVQRSENKECSVCLEKVWERDGDKRFGILENCDHVFCLDCIRKWRAASSYDNRVVKACPACRIKSDFVTPAKYWPESQESKATIINDYKENLRQIHCKFFKRGEGHCPFGSKCFYLHVDKNGRTVTLEPPRRILRLNGDGEVENYSNRLAFSIFSENNGPLFAEYDFLFDDENDPSDDEYTMNVDQDRSMHETEADGPPA